jgi:uncharacterized integral membrane protein
MTVSDRTTDDPMEQPVAQHLEHPVTQRPEHPVTQTLGPPVEPAAAYRHEVPTSRLSSSADIGGLIAGVVFTVLGVLFLLEAGDVWTFSLSDLRYLAPLALIVIGGAVLAGGLKQADAGVDGT